MRIVGLGLWCFGLLVLGCDRPQLRLQDGEDAPRHEIAEVPTIGDETVFGQAQSMRVFGIGVVTGLAGTGSPPPPDEYRRMAVHYLKTRGIENPADFLATSDTAVVLVSAVLPPGVRNGEPLDVQVEVPERDKTRSLRGGYLETCELRQYEDAHVLRGNEGSHASLRGKVLARAQGPIVTGLVDDDDKNRLRRGHVWGGGKSMLDRNFMLLLKEDDKFLSNRQKEVFRGAFLAKTIADRINEVFHGPVGSSVRGMAEAKDHRLVTLMVPPQYRHNLSRYLRVVRQVPLRGSAADLTSYRKRLAEQLLDPALTVVAALKLEALGRDSLDSLQRGLRHSHPLVRFCSAEALAYLGDPACGEPLAQLVEEEPRLRSFGLTALASLNESICTTKLRELMTVHSAETRYGAFMALRALNPQDPALGQEHLQEQFYLHRVAPGSTPLVHLCSARRPEVVLFGDRPRLVPPFDLQAGSHFVVTAEDEKNCYVCRVSVEEGVEKEKCSVRLDEILRTMAMMGADYQDAVELLRHAEQYRNLSCPLAVDALPKTPSVYSLGVVGAMHPAGDTDELEAEPSENAVELGGAPDLFALTHSKFQGRRHGCSRTSTQFEMEE
jgi:flagellar basal body P-ring protein FlgI